jgi:hypothetical protein
VSEQSGLSGRRLCTRRCRASSLVLLFIVAASGLRVSAQAWAASNANPGSSPDSALLPDAPSAQPSVADDVTLRDSPRHILEDQEAIWTSPAHIRAHDLVWLVPLVGAESAAIATDHHVMNSVLSHDPTFNQYNVNASNIVIGSLVAVPVAIYGYGRREQDAHAEEAGIVSGEAILDGVVVEQGMKLIFWRERPAVDRAHGLFFQSSAGVDSSFPSSHSVLAWAGASALAEEYQNPFIKVGLYSIATGISFTRIMGQQHFPGDVLAGSAAGWLVGHYVCRARHRHAADALR